MKQTPVKSLLGNDSLDLTAEEAPGRYNLHAQWRLGITLLLVGLLLRLDLLNSVHDESAAKHDGWFVNIVMFVATLSVSMVVSSSLPLRYRPQPCHQTYLNVPTPPASSNKLGFALKLPPTHLAANALEMCPCATINTSLGEHLSFPAFASFITRT